MKRIELDKGTAIVIENYTPETKEALNKMCTLLLEAVQTEKLSILKPNWTDGKMEEGQNTAFERTESIIKGAIENL